MPQHIKIYSEFDITNTGVTRNFKPCTFPQVINGVKVSSEQEWGRLRKQQCNWETVVQVVSLRTQPFDIQTTKLSDTWILEFDIDHTGVYFKDHDPVGLLRDDFRGVAMITGLNESKALEPLVVVDGPDPYIRIESSEV